MAYQLCLMIILGGGSEGASVGHLLYSKPWMTGVFYLYHLPFISPEPDGVGAVLILGMMKPRFREVKRSPKVESCFMTQQKVKLGSL